MGTFYRDLNFNDIVSQYGTIVEQWKFQDAGPYSQTANTIPDSKGASDGSSDKSFNYNRTGLTFGYQNAPIANTGTTGCFSMLHQNGSLGSARLDIGQISATYNCNGTTNPWTFFVFMKIVVTGTLTGTSSGPDPKGAAPHGVDYNFTTGNWMWSSGAVDTGIPFANGNTNMLAWTGINGGSGGGGYGYVFNGTQVATRYSSTNYNLGAGSSGDDTNIHCAYVNGINGTNYAKTYWQDATIISSALVQDELQAIYDKAMEGIS